ncbi:MAG: Ig-like domain-containing protein [Cellulomonas sp.]
MALFSRLMRRRRTVASISTISIFSTALVALALTNPGLTSTDVELNDSGVWVTRSQDNLAGRFNHEAEVLDGAVTSGTSSFDVLQQADAVLIHDTQVGTISPVDTAGLEFTGSANTPVGALVGLGGQTVAILDPKSGSLWVLPFDGAGSFSAKTTEPVATLDQGAVLAVGTDGTVHAAVGSRLVTVTTSDRGAPGEVTERTLEVADPKTEDLAITAVGADAVVLDRSGEQLLLPNGDAVKVAHAADVVLQQPGPPADAVVLADADALVSQPVDGSKPRQLAAEASGQPAAPVFLGGCAYGAWAGSGQVVRDCVGKSDDLVRSLELTGADARLQYRVNRGVVVLNELTSGSIWLADQDFELFDDWKDVLPSEDDQLDKPDATPDTAKDPLQERDKPNRPPVATDDDLGVRPGRTTILKLLDNDTDPDGDVLTADVSAAESSLGALQPIYGGAAVQLAVAADASGATSFDYVADDGRGGTDPATVNLSVHGWDQNASPAAVRETIVVVEQGKSAEVNVLEDWLDPDGDDLLLTGATAATDDEVRFRPDGVVTFQDAGTSQGRKAVTILVSDGQGDPVEGTLWIDVRPTGQQAPVTQPDHVTTTVGRPVTVMPLRNDTDPNGDVLRLVRVDEALPGVVTPDFEAQTFSFVADVARVYYLTYLVSDGPASTLGLVRIDVLPEPDGSAAPIAVRDTALLPAGGEVLVDVVANDLDPSGGVLVVQSVQTPPNSGVSVELINHQILRIREIRALTDRLTVEYTISNGAASATGEVLVLPVPASPRLRPPVAVDDEATVRAGDVVTIPVLANDSHPDNAVLSLVPELVEQPEPADGLIFTADKTVRFQAGPEAKTVYAVYEVVDPQGQRDSAQITIYVRPANAEQNSAPRPREVTARVLAGSTVRIPIPLDGIDPDGDSVTLLGLDKAPDKGRVVTFGQGWMEFEASRSASGVDGFTYAVEDTYGARAVGRVLIGIAPPPQVNQPPQAVDDLVTVRPGRTVSVAVMANDVDPDGDQIGLISNGLEAEGTTPKVVLDRVVLDAPEEPGVYTVYYTIQDTFGEQSMAALAVDVRADALLRNPIARDDLLTLGDILGKTTVDVPVLDNDEDPDGSATKLEVTSGAATATVLATRQLRVALTETTQVIPYTVTDPDGLTATAFLRVPGLSSLRPTLVAGLTEVEVISGETLTVNLADYVVVAGGKAARITEASTVRALRGTAAVVDENTLTYVSDSKYYGPAALTFEVTDGASTEDPTGRKALLTLPIRVLPGQNEPPTFAGASISVVAGERATADLAKYATDPDPDDAGKLTFAVTGAIPAGLGVRVNGTGLEVTAENSVPKGTVATVALEVTDGVTAPVAGSVTISVVASNRPLAAANDDVVPEAFQGRTAVVPVLANDANPFPGTPLTLVDAQVETGPGTAARQGSDVAITPAADFVGTMVVRYRIADATGDADRQVDGRVMVTVQGRPEAPLTPTVVEVRNKTVVLSWSPPVNNGSVITGYTVTSPSGYSRQCAATTCTLDGLTNDVEYTFSVVATNAVGDSDPSSASAPARPDAKPDAPQPPTLVFGDKTLTVTWANATYSDRSPIESVTLEISPAPPSGSLQKVAVTGNSLGWDGLQNGVPYRVRIQAVNRAPDPSDWGAYSASEIPAGVPGQPAAPTTAGLAPVGSQAQMQVSWPAAAPNGDAVSQYALTVLRGGAALRTIPVAGTQTSQAVLVDASESDYTFTVSATNKAGVSAVSNASAPRRGVLAPGPVKGLSAAPGNNAVQLAFAAADGNGAKPGEIRYQYQVNGGGWANLAADNRVTSGVPNNGTYTVGARAVSTVAGADYVGPGTNANAVAPFGAPGTPGAGATGRTTDVVLSWSPPARNGRDFRIQISVDGGVWTDQADSGSTTVGNDYDQTHTIAVRAVDVEGQDGPVASASARTSARPPPPAAAAQTGKGSSAVGMGICTHPSCAMVTVSFQNWPSETGNAQCQEFVGGAWSTWTVSWVSRTFAGNGTVQLECFTGYPGRQIRVVLPSGAIASPITW